MREQDALLGDTPIMLGKTLRGRYQIIRQLGSGGFGETYLAEDRDLPGNPQCVVKQLKPKDSDPSVLQMARRLFDTEAQVLYRLGKHEQIPQLFAHFEESQEFYLVQEFIEGEDLSQELTPSQRLSESQVVALLQDVLQILAFVHQQNVIHRDIKPSNLIRRRRDGKLVLIDFGAVKEIRTLIVNAKGQTSCTMPIGSSGYMPNEQQGGKPRLNSDIYALGMTAIQALTGILPEQWQEDPQTGEIDWREQVQVSNSLAVILDKMVRSHFRDRYQSAEEVLADLQRLQASTATQTRRMLSGGKGWQQWVKVSQLLLILATAGVTFGFSKLFQSTASDRQPLPPAPVASSAPSPPVSEAVALLNQGNTLVELRRYDEAIATYDKVLQLEPDNPEVWVKRGEAFTKLQRYEEALKDFDEALKRKSDYPPAWYQRGMVLEKLKRYPEALASLDKAVEIQPNYPEAWRQKTVVLVALKRYEEALVSVDRVMEIQPDASQTWQQRGWVLRKLQRYEDALEALEKALQLQSADPMAWIEKGRVMGQLKQYEPAIAALDRALGFDANAAEAWSERGYLLGQLKRYEEAIAALEKAVQLQPDDGQAWYRRGVVLAYLKQYEAAIAAYDRAIQIQPDDSQAWYQRGVVLEKMQKDEEAIAAYDKAIQIWPANQTAIENRKRLLIKLRR